MKYENKKSKFRILFGLMLAAAVFAGTVSLAATKEKEEPKEKKGPACKVLCSQALSATGGSKYLKYMSSTAMDFGALSASARKKVVSIQYVCDSREVYSLCVMEAADAAKAKKLLNCVKKYQKNNCGSNYLSDYSAAEQKVFKNAICGKKGKYVWYIAMSTKKASNKKGQETIKKRIA